MNLGLRIKALEFQVKFESRNMWHACGVSYFFICNVSNVVYVDFGSCFVLHRHQISFMYNQVSFVYD
ncbi:hypothetical protein HanIR_Chr14g0677501 [Helianthus annuus]|nr:hypothetical protein HanIR_Chr14g0677501 [Helianthus annuus]